MQRKVRMFFEWIVSYKMDSIKNMGILYLRITSLC